MARLACGGQPAPDFERLLASVQAAAASPPPRPGEVVVRILTARDSHEGFLRGICAMARDERDDGCGAAGDASGEGLAAQLVAAAGDPSLELLLVTTDDGSSASTGPCASRPHSQPPLRV